jgi:phosphatidate cytidylyltransferase
MERSGGELAKRVGVAFVGIPLTVALAYMGGYWLAGLIAAFAGLAAWEFCRMYSGHGVASAPALAGILAALYVVLAATMPPASFLVWAVVITLAIAAGESIRRTPDSQPGLTVVTTVFGALYTGALLSFAVWIRGLGVSPGLGGAAIVFLPVVVTWVGDTAAYFVGKGIGRHKFAPVISPKKTWEGAIGGLLASAGVSVLWIELTASVAPWTMSLAEAIGFGVLISVAGQVGDLFESRFKRECHVKDSSNLIPGHGGFLDRVDSLLFVFPVAYAYLLVVGL